MKEEKDYKKELEKMIKTQIQARGIDDPVILKAMRKIPRHLFVPDNFIDSAYKDGPVPIGLEQTISQPFIVAEMTKALELKKEDKVLEIGTGSGYQAAILAEIVSRVYTIERIESLLSKAKKLFKSLGYNNIETLLSDGTEGWLEKSPFDAIIVTAASPKIPQSLVLQLNLGGRMVIPVGGAFIQDLVKIYKDQKKIETYSLGGCRFVKLIGKYGWND